MQGKDLHRIHEQELISALKESHFSWVAEGLESQPSSQGTLPWLGTVFYPVVIFFSYLGSVSVCLLWVRARLVSYRKSTCCYRGWGRVGGIPPLLPWQDFGSCVCPVHILRIPEPSPSSLMALQVLHVPQGRWAEGTTVGPHNSPSPKFGSTVEAGWLVACGRIIQKSLGRGTARPVASA